MDEAELKDLIPPKEQNPLLKRKPLNLGTRFLSLSAPEAPLEIDSILTRPHLTLLFFAAEWCNISKSFIPTLKAFYEQVNLEEKKLEIIYVGFDKNKKDYENFTKDMPWLGLTFADERTAGLKEFYDIRSIPKLVLCDSHGEDISRDCRAEVYGGDPDATVETWSQVKNQQDKKFYYQNAG